MERRGTDGRMCFSTTVSGEYQGYVRMSADRDDRFGGSVGGEMLDFMLGRLNEFARIVMCGAISDYSEPA